MRRKRIPGEGSVTEQVLSEANASGVSFLLTELEMALTFLVIAQTSDRADSVRRNQENALAGYRTVQQFLPKVKPDVAQRQEIHEKLAILKGRLLKAGYRV